MKSQCDIKETVVYHLRYRQEIGGDDDEKESEWTELALDEGVNQHRLTELRMGTRYQISGMYQVMDSSLWSAMSKNIPFTTAASSLQWDPSRSGNGIELSNNNTTIKHTDGGNYRPVITKQPLRVKDLLSVDWTVTINELGSSTFYHQLGFVDSSNVDSIDLNENHHLGRDGAHRGNKEHAWWIYNIWYTYTNGKESPYFDRKYSNSNIKKGDRFRLFFDFEKGKCDLYYNGEYVGILTDALNQYSEIYLVENPFYQVTATSNFTIVSKK